ncbi:hypothetical protein [Streptomyces noursei]|uniref:Uncharacterized protein n=1 Tax=Streptomyces noursei TaxID=1971 RepID=A0A2N8PRA5_STRNR|nr:hypothetical protein [Streptomyces noursei]PNE43519.1 hypothetical protein AOB60_01045 [Streptomyces noursei]
MKVMDLAVFDSIVGRRAAVTVDGQGCNGRVSRVGPQETRQGVQGREVTWAQGGSVFATVEAEALVGGTCYLPGTQAGMRGYVTAELRGEQWHNVVFQKRSPAGDVEAEYLVSDDAQRLLDEIATAISKTGVWQHSIPACDAEIRLRADDLRQIRGLVECAVVHV